MPRFHPCALPPIVPLSALAPWRLAWLALLAVLGMAAPAALTQSADEYTLTLPPGPASPPGGTLRFIGNATVLIQFQGLTILTDPNFLPRGGVAQLGYGMWSERLAGPALALASLPQVDLVVLSHLHEDHFDRLVQARLRRDMPVVTTKEAAEQLERLGFTQRYGLSRWDSLTVSKGSARLRITALPARHGPRGLAWLMPSVMGTILDFAAGPQGPAYRIYMSGDTVLYDELNLIPSRFPDIDLALMHLGGMRLLGSVKVTMDGADGVRLLQMLGPRRVIALHFGDYGMFKSPLSEFRYAVQAAGMDEVVIPLERGDTYVLPLARAGSAGPGQ
jgi:L-ascorbate metabolism protein UlaG (beta-lactamase superfamily)